MAKRRPTEVIHTGEVVSSSYNTAERLSVEEAGHRASKGTGSANAAAKRIRKRPKVIDATGQSSTGTAGNIAEPQDVPPPPPPIITPPPIKSPAPKPVSATTPPPKSSPPGKPAMVNKIGTKPVSPEQLSREMATAAVSSLVEQMTTKADLNGGFLRTADIKAMEQEFHVQVSDLTQSMVHSFEAYVESREKASWDSAREFPFWRVVVKKFSYLFGEHGKGRMDTISKRMLPGFFAGLNMMIGPESVDLYQERCRRVVDSIRQQDKDAFDWDKVYASTEITAIVFDALMAIAPHFEDFEKRQNWFIELVNGNLAPIDENNSDDSGWELSPAGYKRFLSALYGDLNNLLANKLAYNQIAKRYGSNALDAVKGLVRRAQGQG